MNCANHPDRERAAFCQNCGKPLCTECVRNVGTSVFCEPCLTARVAGAPPAGYPAAGYAVPPPSVPGEPNPALAGFLGLIPGVGAMYNGQYAKGIVHLIVFAVLTSLSENSDIFGWFVAGWICYMAIEAYHTARARRDGTPLPNPFGLNDLSERLGFGRSWPGAAPPPGADPAAQYPGQSAAGPAQDAGTTYAAGGGYYHRAADGSQTYSAPGAYYYRAPDGSQTYSTAVPPFEAPPAPPYGMPPVPPVPPVPPYAEPDPSFYRRFPSGAIWLIVLGLFFLVGNAPFFHILHGRFLVPVLMIGFGVWIFVHKMTSSGHGIENDGTPLYHWRLTRAMNCSFWIVLVGVIWLLDELHILSWSRSWPLFIIGAGLMMVFRRTAHPGIGYGYPAPPAPPATPPPAAPVTSTEIVPTHSTPPGSNDQEGR